MHQGYSMITRAPLLNSLKRQNGFTLIEVLVSLAIFAIMSALAYQALGQTLSNTELLHERVDRVQAIQRTMNMLGRDLFQSSPRPVRDGLDGAQWHGDRPQELRQRHGPRGDARRRDLGA